MATAADVRRIALSLPDTDEHPSYGGRPSFRVHKKGFVALQPDGETAILHVMSVEEKEELLAADPHKFFTTSHYDGYPMVLVRVASLDVDELRELITDAWRLKAPKKLVAVFDASSGAN